MKHYLQIFASTRMLLMLLMGFSSGLPLALTGGTFQAWMSNSGIDIKTIGLFSLVGLPYTLKFVWAPLMDRYVPEILGRRRGWMLITQLALVAAIFTLVQANPQTQLSLVALLALCLAFFSASQDIVIDAYRTELMSAEERGAAAAISNLGYRLGMLASGALALGLADRLAWNIVYRLMAILMMVGILATLLAPEPGVEAPPPKSLNEAVAQPFLQYFNRRGALEILAFIIIYKLDIVMASALTTPFMLGLGYSKTEIGFVTKGVGMAASIVGSLVGGVYYTKWGTKRSLIWFGIIQGLSTLSFGLLAAVGYNNTVMAGVVGFENFCAGLATAPFIAFLMSLCDKRFTATQYALLSSLAAVSRVIAGAPTGFLVAALGWQVFFVICAFLALPGLLLLHYRFAYWLSDPSTVDTF